MGKGLLTLKNLLFPRHCVGCQCRISGEIPLCPTCLEKYQREKNRRCPLCKRTISECTCRPSFQSKAVLSYISLVPYDKNSVGGKLILYLKSHKSREVADFLAKDLFETLEKRCMPEEHALITYVPRSKRALKKEGTDQARELAKALSKESHIEMRPLLKRKRGFRPQKELSMEQRERKAEHRYQLLNMREEFEGRTILLVDDILTTGATLKAAAQPLYEKTGRPLLAFTVGRTGLSSKKS